MRFALISLSLNFLTANPTQIISKALYTFISCTMLTTATDLWIKRSEIVRNTYPPATWEIRENQLFYRAKWYSQWHLNGPLPKKKERCIVKDTFHRIAIPKVKICDSIQWKYFSPWIQIKDEKELQMDKTGRGNVQKLLDITSKKKCES